jgi:signal transduction histidine kinase
VSAPAAAGPAPAGPAPAGRVIVIDDDAAMLGACTRVLGAAGYDVVACDRGATGVGHHEASHPAVMLVDLRMPEIDGMEVIRRVRATDAETVIAVMTGQADVQTAVEAMQAGAHDFLPKPFSPAELRHLAARCMERLRLTREAARLRREKAAAERRFVTFVSHELKSPLVAVKQCLDTLVYRHGAALPEGAGEWITRSQQRVGGMLDLIADWLTLARVEQGGLCKAEDGTCLAPLVAQLLAAAQPQAEAAGVALSSAVPPELPAVRGDARALGVVVENLVGNAIKYNRRGGSVVVRARAVGPDAFVEVSDTGVGIPAAALPELGREFFRVHDPAAAGRPGTGLGLAICRRILAELDGGLDVVSTPGEGSTFTARVPLAVTPGA